MEVAERIGALEITDDAVQLWLLDPEQPATADSAARSWPFPLRDAVRAPGGLAEESVELLVELVGAAALAAARAGCADLSAFTCCFDGFGGAAEILDTVRRYTAIRVRTPDAGEAAGWALTALRRRGAESPAVLNYQLSAGYAGRPDLVTFAWAGPSGIWTGEPVPAAAAPDLLPALTARLAAGFRAVCPDAAPQIWLTGPGGGLGEAALTAGELESLVAAASSGTPTAEVIGLAAVAAAGAAVLSWRPGLRWEGLLLDRAGVRAGGW